MTHPRPPLARCSNGELVRRLVAGHVSRLVDLQIPVLADDDPEPLHQMRVAMRRLRTTLRQFAPAVVLPGGVSDQRIARSVRRLGLARDLDVLRQRLRDELPALPQQEAAALKPVFRQLKRERRVAYTQLVEVLRGRSHLELLARLQEWLRRPEFTPLGREPLGRWLPEWQLPPLLQLFVHSGWWAEDPQGQAERMHDLRKQIKDARYRLENLRHCGGRRQRAAISDLRNLQDLLGELHDLEVLTAAINQQTPHSLASDLPVLAVALEQRRRCCWERWRDEARRLNSAAARAELLHGLQRELARHRLKVMCPVIHGRVSPRLATAMACR